MVDGKAIWVLSIIIYDLQEQYLPNFIQKKIVKLQFQAYWVPHDVAKFDGNLFVIWSYNNSLINW